MNARLPKLHIGLTPGFDAEKKYIAELIFNRFLGFDINFRPTSFNGFYSLNFGQKEPFLVKDSFWANIPEGSSYVQKKYLPQKIAFFKEENIVSLFGSPSRLFEQYSAGKLSLTQINADIFADAFFCLSRWEECLGYKKDKFKRFQPKDSILIKNDLIHRPLVNEYCQFIRQFISRQFSIKAETKQKFKQFLTHDIDSPIRWQRANEIAKTLAGDILKRQNFKLFSENLKAYQKHTNHFDQISNFIKLAEKTGSESVFYFLMHPTNILGLKKSCSHWTKLLKEKRCGLHPDLNTYSFEKLNRQKQSLEAWLRKPVNESRQHYLQWEWPTHLQLLEKAGIQYDSSLYFTDAIGFRTSCCWEYPLFDITSRRMTSVIERPLLFMDVSLTKSELPENDLWGKAYMVKEQCKKHNGAFTSLWHNSSLYSDYWHEQFSVFKELLDQ